MNNSTALDWAALVAVALALIHLAAPLIRGVLAERAATLGIFGSGMAISYVFIHLFNEIDAGHKLLGISHSSGHAGGVLCYYWVESRVLVKARSDNQTGQSEPTYNASGRA